MSMSSGFCRRCGTKIFPRTKTAVGVTAYNNWVRNSAFQISRSKFACAAAQTAAICRHKLSGANTELRSPVRPLRLVDGSRSVWICLNSLVRVTLFRAHRYFLLLTFFFILLRTFMNILRLIALITVPVLTTEVSFAQSANMMNDRTWGNSWMGGYSGMWMPILIITVVVALVVWIIKQKK